MTLQDTLKPDESYLEAILPAALGDRNEDKFLSDYLSGLSHCLNADPRYYRGVGPWWPSLKALLVESGDLSAGIQIDDDIAEIYQYEKPALIAVAAYLYQSMRMTNGLLFSSSHQLAQPDTEDEPYEFISYDLELESKVVQMD
ncbi:olxA [Pantoea sp. CCBC3-3-1]|uniref:olxA n=1 Tax=Pantoea sp. CCBC3-3-1 TaxID=2490851 RepID=UPI0011BD4C0A|nr:olxA [Pantoea sp. CCBC3-3-1]